MTARLFILKYRVFYIYEYQVMYLLKFVPLENRLVDRVEQKRLSLMRFHFNKFSFSLKRRIDLLLYGL